MGIFGAKAGDSQIYKVGDARVTINNSNAVMLQTQVQVSRNLQPIATLGHGIHWAAQPPSGTLTATAILTRDSDLVSTLGANDACTKLNIVVNMSDAVCNGGAGKTITINDGYCSTIGFTLSAQQGYISSDVTISFTDCVM